LLDASRVLKHHEYGKEIFVVHLKLFGKVCERHKCFVLGGDQGELCMEVNALEKDFKELISVSVFNTRPKHC
jgi:hypothetical protein